MAVPVTALVIQELVRLSRLCPLPEMDGEAAVGRGGEWGAWLGARRAVWLGEDPHLPSLGKGTKGEEGGLQSSSGQLVTGGCTFSSSSPRPSTHSEHPHCCPHPSPLPPSSFTLSPTRRQPSVHGKIRSIHFQSLGV